MRLMRTATAILLVFAANACNPNDPVGEDKEQTPEPGVAASPRHGGDSSSTTERETVTQGTQASEVFSPPVDPEVSFTGPLANSAGSLVIRYESNSWKETSGIATLPSVGDLRWFLDTDDGCMSVDRSAFIEATGEGHEIILTPSPAERFRSASPSRCGSKAIG